MLPPGISGIVQKQIHCTVRQSAKHSPQYYEPDERQRMLSMPDVRPRKWQEVSDRTILCIHLLGIAQVMDFADQVNTKSSNTLISTEAREHTA